MYKDDCLFCRIAKGEIPSTKVYEDDVCLAFRDIAPKAPAHILMIPKTHMESCAEITAEAAALTGHMFVKIAEIAAAEGLKNGYRVVTNCGPDSGQEVSHLHFHILGGKKLGDIV